MEITGKMRTMHRSISAKAEAVAFLEDMGFSDQAVLNPGAHREMTAFSVAAREGRLAVCQWLASAGARADARRANAIGETPLSWAVTFGHGPVVTWLVEECGAFEDALRADCLGNTCFHVAALEGHLSILRYLFEKDQEEGSRGDINTDASGATAAGEGRRPPTPQRTARATAACAEGKEEPEGKDEEKELLGDGGFGCGLRWRKHAEGRGPVAGPAATTEHSARHHAKAAADAATPELCRANHRGATPFSLALGAGHVENGVAHFLAVHGALNAPLPPPPRTTPLTMRTGRAEDDAAEPKSSTSSGSGSGSRLIAGAGQYQQEQELRQQRGAIDDHDFAASALAEETEEAKEAKSGRSRGGTRTGVGGDDDGDDDEDDDGERRRMRRAGEEEMGCGTNRADGDDNDGCCVHWHVSRNLLKFQTKHCRQHRATLRRQVRGDLDAHKIFLATFLVGCKGKSTTTTSASTVATVAVRGNQSWNVGGSSGGSSSKQPQSRLNWLGRLDDATGAFFRRSIADFAGILYGRRLRNARELHRHLTSSWAYGSSG